MRANKIRRVLLIILVTFVSYSQDKFKIRLKAKSFIQDSLILGVPDGVPMGFEELYHFKIETDDKVNDLKVKMGFTNSYYSIKIETENILTGNTNYPKPVNFIYSKPQNDEMPVISGIFFIEKGTFQIDLPSFKNNYEVFLNSPTNIDFKKLKKSLSSIYVKSKNSLNLDSLISFDKKQQLLKKHILRNPNSYAALWQIIFDYSEYHQEQNYQEILQHFSVEMKNSKLFKDFTFKLDQEKATAVGKTMPPIYLDNNTLITLDSYSNYELTLVDYWSTTCGPCIKALPEIVDTHQKFKNTGLNIISISDDISDERIEMANKILIRNKASWSNYFDLQNDFKNKVNATGYPFYMLIDKKGRILLRSLGDFNLIKDSIIKKLNNENK